MAVTLTGTITSSCCLPSHKTSSLGLTRSRRSITSPTHGRLSSVMLPMRTNIHSSFSQINASTSSNREAVRSDLNQNMKTPLPFTKYHGLGNDFILVDNRDSTEPKVTPEQAIKLCDRNFGVGADGVIFAMRGINGTDYVMRIFNSDGSEPEMCGNGIRCMACFVAELENSSRPRSYTIETGAGLIVPKLLEDGKVMVDMGEPKLHPADIPTKLEGQKNDIVVKAELFVDNKIWMATCVSMGNPHCVIFSAKNSEEFDISSLSLKDIGPSFEHHDMFPARTNTEFVEVLSASHLRMRVWERGAGETLACGTGACAVVVAAVLEGRSERKCLVDLPGGPLEIEWNKNDNHVYMTGPAEKVFSGTAFL